MGKPLTLIEEFGLDEPCTRELHDELRADPFAWKLATTYLGIQDCGDERYEVRNCVRCHSSLMRRMP